MASGAKAALFDSLASVARALGNGRRAEIVDVLVGVVPIVGLPCAVAEAPKLALALGYDVDDALEHQSGK